MIILAVGTLLPMVVFAVIAASLLAERERATFQRGATEQTRALLTAVDTELKRSVAALESLAVSRELDVDDLRGFHAEARRVLESQPDWLTIILASPKGEPLVNARYPVGTALPPIMDPASFDKLVRTKTPQIGDLAQGAVDKLYGFPVRVPVLRNGTVHYVLTAVVKPDPISALLSPQRLPPNWVAAILDNSQRIVARTVDPAGTVGQTASESLRAALARAPEGWFHGSTVEGWEVYTPYHRSSFSGWTVAMGIPAAIFESATRETIWSMTAGILAAGLIAFALALALSRRISEPIVALAAAAKAIGGGEPARVPLGHHVEEVADLSRAIEEAAAAVRTREEAQGQLAAIVEASTDAMISFSLEGAILTWNQAAARLFGYSAEEIQGKRVSLIVPEDRSEESADLRARVSRGESIAGFETVRLKKRGTLFDVAISMSPIRSPDGRVTGIAEIVRDISQRKRAYEALRDSESRFSALAELVPQLVWSAAPEGAVDYLNHRWYEYTGFNPEQSLGWGWLEAIHPQQRDPVRARWQEALRTHNPVETELRLRCADGHYEWFLMRAVPLRDAGGGVTKWFGTCTEIEKQKRAAEALQEADRRKDEFMAMLGHELRNPLGVVSTVTQLLHRKMSDVEDLVELREMIERQVRHMSRLIDDLLDVSRIARGRIQLNKQACNLTEVVNETVTDYRSGLEAQGLCVEVQLPEHALWVMGDRTRLAQVIGNVLHNAGKFTDAGGMITVRLGADGNDRFAVLTIADTGRGMDSETLAHAFDSFSQADHGIDRRSGGLGLGLALVKGLIELHGGEVRAFSEGLGRGTEIAIRLPLEALAGETSKQPVERAPGPVCPRRVLIVEDNPIAAASMRMFLAEAGHEVETADTGFAGLDAARRFRPEVVLCDIGLPGLDGYQLAAALRQEPGLKGVYLVAVTGYAQHEDQERARDAGFDLHLKKPVDLDQLERILAKLEAPPPRLLSV
ncbi:MAG TPA: PAS domain S-box protein [Candidatus Eisenbacteria bacterium]|nr:PAS domain S-box protein [Candidatus Eisenbacteria bacterium]